MLSVDKSQLYSRITSSGGYTWDQASLTAYVDKNRRNITFSGRGVATRAMDASLQGQYQRLGYSVYLSGSKTYYARIFCKLYDTVKLCNF